MFFEQNPSYIMVKAGFSEGVIQGIQGTKFRGQDTELRKALVRKIITQGRDDEGKD
jgi:hypothetical protein